MQPAVLQALEFDHVREALARETLTPLGRARALALDPADFLARNDAYHFFEPLGGLIKTGPTHTNVCDLRVVVVSREASNSA